MTRRTLLGAAVLASAAACSPSPTPARPTSRATTTPPPPTTTEAPVPADWNALRARLPGGLFLPADSGYDTARRSYNSAFDDRRPAAVARCTRPEDVRACVDVARDARMPVAARSGGHSYAGYSTPDDALVLDLRPMASVQVQGDRAVVGAGARLAEVYDGLAAAGRALPAGTCPSVGIAGLTLGGGIGVLTRKYGLTCDRVVAAEIVTADGELRIVQDGDLFWALRGGGGGNFGVVTSFTFATEPAPDVVVFSAQYRPGSAADVLGAWQGWISRTPDEMWSNCIVTAGSPPSCRLTGAFVGTEAACHQLLDQLPPARAVTVTGMSYLDAMRHFAGCSDRSLAQCLPRSEGGGLGRDAFTASSRILTEPLADPARLVDLVTGRRDLDVLVDPLGGAVARGPDSAFAYRDAFASAQIYAAAGQETAVAEVRDGLGRLTGPTGYVNYIDATMPDWPTAYYGDNLARLREVAATYDPDGVFAFAQGLTAPDR